MVELEEVSVAVTLEIAEAMRDAVATGEYASSNQVIQEALRDWAARRADREQAIEEIGRAWDIGIASGPPMDGEEVFARLFARLQEKVDQRKAG